MDLLSINHEHDQVTDPFVDADSHRGVEAVNLSTVCQPKRCGLC